MEVRDSLKLDIHKNNDYKYIQAKQYDTNSRYIDITLYDNDVLHTIEEDVIARVRGTKKDQTYFIVDCPIENNTVIVELEKQMTNVCGKVVCDIGLYKPANTGNPFDDKLLSSAVFNIIVSPSAYSEDAVVSSNEFKTLTELIAENRILGDELQSKINTATILIEQMQQILNS